MRGLLLGLMVLFAACFESFSQSNNELLQLITELKAKGYHFVKVNQLGF